MSKKSQPFIESVRRRLSLYPEAGAGRILLCCVSGGADSTALFHALRQISTDMGFFFEAIHVNHGIRGKEADQDEALVKRMCKKAGAPLHIRRLEFCAGEKISEDAMRKKRYEAIRECAKKIGASAAVLGHQQDDLAETFLMRLFKGAGLRGLSGFREYSLSGDLPLIRPMKNLSRKDILLFLRRNRLSWREDRSNRDTAYLRNNLRRNLIPLLEKDFNPAIIKTLTECADHFSKVYDYLKRETESLLRKNVKKIDAGTLYGEWIYLKNLESLPDLLMTELFRLWIMDVCKVDSPPGAREIEAIHRLVIEDQSGNLLRLSRGLIAYRDYERIILCRTALPRHIAREKIIAELTPLLLTIQNEPLRRPYSLNPALESRIFSKDLPQKGKTKTFTNGNLEFTLRITERRLRRIDFQWEIPLEAIRPPVVIRTRKASDRIKFKGMTKPMKKWMEEQRIPAPLRDHLLILEDSRGNIFSAGNSPSGESENASPPFLVIKCPPKVL